MKKLKSSIPGWKHLTLCPHWVGNSSKHMYKSIWKQRKRIWQYIKYNSLLVE